jgi:hypothetical protein
MRKDGEPNLTELTEALIGAFPKLDDVKRRVALATYRRLARGEPAPRPASPVVSFLKPVAAHFQPNIIQSFCHYIHFFRSGADGEASIAKNPGTFLLTLDDAARLARLKNDRQFSGYLVKRR